MADTKQNAAPMEMEEEKLNDQMKVRREKMQQFIDAGVYPFGQKFDLDHHTQEIKDQAETLEKENKVIGIAFYVIRKRKEDENDLD